MDKLRRKIRKIIKEQVARPEDFSEMDSFFDRAKMRDQYGFRKFKSMWENYGSEQAAHFLKKEYVNSLSL